MSSRCATSSMASAIGQPAPRVLLLPASPIFPGRARNGILPARSICENVTSGRAGKFGRFGAISPRQERRAVSAALAAVQAKFGTIDDPITSLSGATSKGSNGARAHRRPRRHRPGGADGGCRHDSKEQIHRLIRTAADSNGSLAALQRFAGSHRSMPRHPHHAAEYLVGSHVAPTESDEPIILFDVLGKRREGTPEAERAALTTSKALP